MIAWWILPLAVVAAVLICFAAVLWFLGKEAARHATSTAGMPIALFIVGVDDPTDPVRRYYGPFIASPAAERYAAPLRVDGTHAWVAPLWRP